MSFGRTLFWGTFLLLCLVLGGLKTWQNVQTHAAQNRQRTEFAASQAQYRRDVDQAVEELREQWSKGMRGGPQVPGWTKEELEANLPGRPQLQLVDDPKKPGEKIAAWIHPTAPVEARFYFGPENRLHGFGATSTPFRKLPNQVLSATYNDAGEQLRRYGAHYGRWLWCAVMVAWLFARSYRLTVGDALLAIAISVTIADAVAPNYTLSHIFSNDIVFIDAVLLAISFAAVTVTSPGLRSFVSRRVLSRQFSIRWMMGFTALIAVLVFFGWYGKVVGSVLAVAAMAYGVMAQVHRPNSDHFVSSRSPQPDANNPNTT